MKAAGTTKAAPTLAVFAELPASEVVVVRAPVSRSLVRRAPAPPDAAPLGLAARVDEAPPAPLNAPAADPPAVSARSVPVLPDPEPAAPASSPPVSVAEPPPPLPVVPVSQPPVAPLATYPPLHPPPPPAPPPVPQPAIDFAERLAAAIAALRLTSERLAEQARSDALELALLVARRMLEAEVSTNVERFFGVVRSVTRRAGESQRIVVRLHPDDAQRVDAAGGARSLATMAVAQIEIAPDPELEPGDCVVDADFGMVDGRLTTRFEEMRRLLQEAMVGGDA
ncbi:MAG: flagellar assembly protein FliH [Myxococcales bacterium]|nr:flagellar assembly protein FliH [Myxococcales bacterium]